MHSNLVNQRYNEYIGKMERITRGNLVLSTPDFQCPETGYGVAIQWDNDLGHVWAEIIENISDKEAEIETKRWCLEFGIQSAYTTKEVNRLIYDALGQEAKYNYFEGE